MSETTVVAMGFAVGAAWVATADGAAAARRLAGRPRLAGIVREAALRPWPLPLLAAAASLVLLGPVAAMIGAGGALAGRRALTAVRAAADRERAAAAAASVCSVLVAELRAGRPPDAALALSAEDLPPPLSEALRRAVVSAKMGGDVPAALSAAGAAASESGGLLLRQLATCWQVAGRTGAALAGVVDALATDLRARERLRLETQAALAGPRTTAWLLAALPAVGIAMAAGFGAAPVRVLLRTPLGLACLVLGATLDLLGVLWTRRLVRRALDSR